ncbi:MAG: tetratricopeptide repeat protein [Bifidobacteriaceae bacterium]|nr:tetratricopeptide repeat protein [Bifidobacteriaceae bacterium]
MNNYAVTLGAVGRQDEALDSAHRAVQTYEQLAEANPAAYLPSLATALNNYAARLRDVGRDRQAAEIARRAQKIAGSPTKDGPRPRADKANANLAPRQGKW